WWGGPRDGRGIPAADSPDGSPNGHHILAIDGAQYTTRFVPAAGKSSRQLRAVVNGPASAMRSGRLATHELAACELVVNVFDGGPRTHVTYAIGGRHQAPVPLLRKAICDPFVTHLFAQSRATQKPWVEAVPSAHVWAGPLPCDLETGAHRV